MLQQFHLKEEDTIRVSETALHATVTALFEKLGVPQADARQAASVLVSADLRGVDTHGVSNMLRSYITDYTKGSINARPNWKITRESAATANVDSDRGLGIIVVPRAMDIAIEKAKNVGVGMVTVSNGRHLGMASYHAMMALEHDMIGTCMTSCPPSVLPTFGSEPVLGTNPIALAAPAKNHPPFVYDAATSVIAGNKVHLARRLGANIPPGWLGEDDGTPIMQETEPPVPYRLLPLGSTRESGSHKGYGLGCIVDILSGILSGTAFGAVPGRPNFSHFVAAYSIEAFTDVEQFKQLMDDFLNTLKSIPPAPGQDKVLVAGQPEWETEQERRENGIPLHTEVVEWFRSICSEMSVEYILE